MLYPPEERVCGTFSRGNSKLRPDVADPSPPMSLFPFQHSFRENYWLFATIGAHLNRASCARNGGAAGDALFPRHCRLLLIIR